jgi:phosphoenolpyruvate carboxykinase (GTP)
MRVLKWMIDRIEGQAKGEETMFGVAPPTQNSTGPAWTSTSEQFKTVTHIDKAAWVEELKLHAAHFEQLAYHLPKELIETLEKRLAAV